MDVNVANVKETNGLTKLLNNVSTVDNKLLDTNNANAMALTAKNG